jgi:hypothetical protein
MKLKIIFLFIVCCLLASCAKDAQEPRLSYGRQSKENGFLGYNERLVDVSTYEIQVRGYTTTNSYTLENHFHRRAKELCKFKPYEYDAIRNKTGTRIGYDVLKQGIIVTGVIKCNS